MINVCGSNTSAYSGALFLVSLGTALTTTGTLTGTDVHTSDTWANGPTDATKGCAIAIAWKADPATVRLVPLSPLDGAVADCARPSSRLFRPT